MTRGSRSTTGSRRGCARGARRSARRLADRLAEDTGLKLHSITLRVKTRPSVAAKLARPDRTYGSLGDLTDLIGLRVITYFEDGVDRVARLLEAHLPVDFRHSVDKRKPSAHDRFGYRSLHYVCRLPPDEGSEASCATRSRSGRCSSTRGRRSSTTSATPFFPEYLLRMLEASGLSTVGATRAALVQHRAAIVAMVRPSFRFASAAWRPASWSRCSSAVSRERPLAPESDAARGDPCHALDAGKLRQAVTRS